MLYKLIALQKETFHSTKHVQRSSNFNFFFKAISLSYTASIFFNSSDKATKMALIRPSFKQQPPKYILVRK
jgi:hypothetical protein